MRVTTRTGSSESCWACGKLTKKQIVVNLGYDGVTFGICPLCARKMVKGLVRELNKKEETK
nr:MAG TPA: Rad50 zinc hook motif [Caudoviricetes sp.]